jgi:hypothetical protein
MEEPEQDAQSKQRIASWIRRCWDDGAALEDLPSILLEFEKYLQACEAERMDK